jgi:hypothetical protein
MENNVRNSDCEDQSERITCKNATCKAEIEESESEAKRYNGYFVKFRALQDIKAHIK